MTRPGSRSEFSYDPSNFLTRILHSQGVTSGGALIQSFDYSRDLAGNRATITRDGVATRTLAYDDNQQLTSYTNPDAPAASGYAAETFEYDSVFNRLRDAWGENVYDPKGQRLLEDYRNSYLWDNNGNMISKQGRGLSGEVVQYLYTTSNQLREVRFFENATATSPWKVAQYRYDPTGRRTRKFVTDARTPSNSLERRYIYDGTSILQERDNSNQILARYTHQPQVGDRVVDAVLSVRITAAGAAARLAQMPGNYHYIKDALGSITSIFSDSGSKILEYVYSAYGLVLDIRNSSGISTTPSIESPYAFTGRERDQETGLYYYRARYYDAVIGRFLQSDPHPGYIETPETYLNKYSYASNNPAKFIDPKGTLIFLLALLGGIAATVGGGLIAAGVTAGLTLAGAVYFTIGLVGLAIGALFIFTAIVQPDPKPQSKTKDRGVDPTPPTIDGPILSKTDISGPPSLSVLSPLAGSIDPSK